MLDFYGAWVVMMFIVIGIFGLIGITLFAHLERIAAKDKLNPKKRTVVPQQAFAKPGICMCDDGFNFHIDGKRCNVEGCPCVVYIPSGAEPELMGEIETLGISRLAIESVNSKAEWTRKMQALEASKDQAAADQIGPRNTGACGECGSREHSTTKHQNAMGMYQ